MPITWRYVSYYDGDNEMLVDPPPTDPEELEAFNEGWKELRGDCPHHIEITEDIYNNSENEYVPKWIEVTIPDEGLLTLKMARGVVNSIEGCHAMSFDKFFDVAVSDEWGAVGFSRLYVCAGTAYINIYGNRSNDELELQIGKQLDQALGE